jgi:putative cardiolipin synthase
MHAFPARLRRRIGPMLLLLASAALQGGCHQLQVRPAIEPDAALPLQEATAVDRYFAPLEAAHPGASGFRLVREGPEAFMSRLQAARQAGRSLDVQTYLWHNDTTGLYLAREALRAADRGVQVRLLVDDMDARDRTPGFAALAAHPNIAVRMFNPFASRRGKAAFASEGLRSFGRINRRMHNKSWIADNRIALVGGRNLGDEYFGASDEVNFVDLDFALAGPIVRDASASFDRYWNSAAAYPMETLDPSGVNADALARLRVKLDTRIDETRVQSYRALLGDDDTIRRMLSGDWPLHWSTRFRFVSDDPDKITKHEGDTDRSQVLAAILPLFREARVDLGVISPYFVPGQGGTAVLTGAAASGTRVRVLTNSLAANDVAAVHGGYSRWRPALLDGGVQLWELKPSPGSTATHSLFGSSGASLHTKALVVDARTSFVGSYNLDPRSTWLNCEQGVLVEDAAIAAELEAILAEQSDGLRAWRVTREGTGLRWSDGTRTLDDEPGATAGQRFQAWLARFLRIDAQL